MVWRRKAAIVLSLGLFAVLLVVLLMYGMPNEIVDWVPVSVVAAFGLSSLLLATFTLEAALGLGMVQAPKRENDYAQIFMYFWGAAICLSAITVRAFAF